MIAIIKNTAIIVIMIKHGDDSINNKGTNCKDNYDNSRNYNCNNNVRQHYHNDHDDNVDNDSEDVEVREGSCNGGGINYVDF